MTKITKEELLKIAKMSRLELLDSEVEPLIKQIGDLLSYAERVCEIAADVQIPSNKNVNVFEADVSKQTDPAPFLAQAPEKEGGFFVVPKILDDNQ